MNKIIQFLRLSRLLLLVILLLFAVAAKIARADTAYLYQGRFHFGGAVCDVLRATPQEVLETCYRSAETGYVLGQPKMEGGDYPVNDSRGYWTGWSVSRWKHTCDAKELTHNGVSDGVETPPWFHWISAPKGYQAKTWFPERYESCENNCVVRNTRYVLSDGTWYADEADGTSRGSFNRRQTGEVCVPEPKKKNDPPKPPAPDTDNGTGNGQSNPGSGDGQSSGQGDSGGSGQGSSGSDSQNNQGSGNSDGGGSGSGGSGGGSGGVNGSGGQTGPSGGGTSGGESGGDQAEGSEGSTEGGESGDGQSGSGSGESGSEGGADGGSQGNVGGSEGGQSGSQNGDSGGDGDGEAGGHYISCPSGKGSYKKGTEPSAECLGNGDGQGSIGGGSCEADTPPDCKGDPIQCYIAREQWRTACAASGKSNKIEGQGNCEQLTPPECKGDETQCYIAKQQFISACEAQAQHEARNSLKEYADGKSGIVSDVEASSEDGVKQALEDNGGKIDLNNLINRSGYGWSRSCPASATIDAGVFGTFEIDNSMLCTMAQVLGKIFAALCMLFAVRYIFA